MSQRDSHPPVSTFALFVKLGGIIPLFIAAIWSVSLILSVFVILDDLNTRNQLRPATATVLRHVVTETPDIDPQKPARISYRLELEFPLPGGAMQRAFYRTGGAHFETTQDGDQVPIWYAQNDPSNIEMSQGEKASAALWVILANLVILAVLVALGIAPLSRTRSALRARKAGDWQVVRVSDWQKSKMPANSENEKTYRLMWDLPDGPSGRSLPHMKKTLKSYQKGKTIEVAVDGKRSWWIGDIGQEI